MLGFFFNDTDAIRKRVLALMGFSFLFIIVNFFVINMTIDLAKENKHQAAVFQQQSRWLGAFDGDRIAMLQKSILKPVDIKEVNRVQLEQIQILERNLLYVESVRNDSFKDQTGKKKQTTRSVRTSLVARGDWDGVVNALNEFEKKNFVVITALDLERDGEQVVMKMEYQTYYL